MYGPSSPPLVPARGMGVAMACQQRHVAPLDGVRCQQMCGGALPSSEKASQHRFAVTMGGTAVVMDGLYRIVVSTVSCVSLSRLLHYRL